MHIRVRVEADARRERVRELGEHSYEISVREPAERNAANKRIVALVAARYRVPEKTVRIVKGHRARTKVLEF